MGSFFQLFFFIFFFLKYESMLTFIGNLDNTEQRYIQFYRAKLPQLCLTLCNPMDYCQAPLSMGFSRQEYCHGFSCPPPGYLPDPVTEQATLAFLALAGRFFTTSATWEAWDLIKLKTFAQQRKLSKMKRLPSEWEKNNSR